MMDLDTYLAISSRQPFVWGERDCALWACTWIKERKGVDPGAAYRGRYSTEKECLEIVHGAGGLEALVSMEFKAHGLYETVRQRRGDVVLVDIPTGPTVGIAANEQFISVKTARGIATARQLAVLRAWRV
jgi:hypothetical protein